MAKQLLDRATLEVLLKGPPSQGWGFASEAPVGALKRQQWLGSPFNRTSRVTLSRSCSAAGRLLI